jgi:hypothetical protein
MDLFGWRSRGIQRREILQQAPERVAEAQLSARLPTPAAAAIKIERKKTRSQSGPAA